MNYYAVQVRTGKEPELLAQIKKIIVAARLQPVAAYFPRRVLYIRKKGIKQKVDAPVFPGYIFLETMEYPSVLYSSLRKVTGFYRFLPDNYNPIPLTGKDLAILHHFLAFGEVSNPSRAYFDENSRICIVDGPLKGLEGKIIKVDRRKCRARVRLDIYTDSFPIDLAFELIQPADSGSTK